MEKIIVDIKKDVEALLNTDKSGHGMDHIERVLNLSYDLANNMNVNMLIVSLIALLHDVDDYKLFGEDNAKNLSNARKILEKYKIDDNTKNIVLTSISQIGYSKRLKGIKPQYLEGMIVSDADMLDAMGACGIARSIAYASSKGRKIFDKDIFPTLDLDATGYIKEKDTTMINHVFEKLLKLKDLMLTDNAKDLALIRHNFMVSFLKEYFKELKLENWEIFLEKYLEK